MMILVNSLYFISFSVKFYCLASSSLVHTGVFHELFHERRSDKDFQFLQVFFWFSDLFQCILNGFGDSLARLCQCSIQIKKKLLYT